MQGGICGTPEGIRRALKAQGHERLMRVIHMLTGWLRWALYTCIACLCVCACLCREARRYAACGPTSVAHAAALRARAPLLPASLDAAASPTTLPSTPHRHLHPAGPPLTT